MRNMERDMSAKLANTSHDRLQQGVQPIHDEIGRINVEIEKLRGERSILQALAVSELEKAGISKDAIGHLAAACW